MRLGKTGLTHTSKIAVSIQLFPHLPLWHFICDAAQWEISFRSTSQEKWQHSSVCLSPIPPHSVAGGQCCVSVTLLRLNTKSKSNKSDRRWSWRSRWCKQPEIQLNFEWFLPVCHVSWAAVHYVKSLPITASPSIHLLQHTSYRGTSILHISVSLRVIRSMTQTVQSCTV